jgi:hypothetical protein
MGYGDPGNSIEQDSRRGSGEKRGNPIPEASREPPALKEIKNVFPTNGVKGLPDVELK